MPEQVTPVPGVPDFSWSSLPGRRCSTAIFSAFHTGNDEGVGGWDDDGSTEGWEDGWEDDEIMG